MPPRPNMNAFRNSQHTRDDLRPPKNYEPWETEIFKMEVDETALIRILPPTGAEFPLISRHWAGGSRTCTRHRKGFDGKCVYCYYLDKAEKGSKERDNLYPRGWNIAEVIDFRYFHKTKDKEGNTQLEVCACRDRNPQRNRCRLCSNIGRDISERQFGGHKVWELGKQHFDQLVAVQNQMARLCIAEIGNGQTCGQEVYEVAYNCGNPDCQYEFVSEADLQGRKSEEEIGKIVDNRQTCPKCGYEGLPAPQYICASEQHEPFPAMVYDKNLEVTKAGKVEKDRQGNPQTRSTLNFDRSAPFTNIIDDLVAHGFSAEDAEKMCAPWDLERRFRPEGLDRSKYNSDEEYIDAVLNAQAERLSKKNPYPSFAGTGGGGEERGRPWGRFRGRG